MENLTHMMTIKLGEGSISLVLILLGLIKFKKLIRCSDFNQESKSISKDFVNSLLENRFCDCFSKIKVLRNEHMKSQAKIIF